MIKFGDYKVGDLIQLTDETLEILEKYPSEIINGYITEISTKGVKVLHGNGIEWCWGFSEIFKV